MSTVLVLGASGALGGSICDRFTEAGWSVQKAGRTSGTNQVCVEEIGWAQSLTAGSINAVVWASGANVNDAMGATDEATLLSMLESNVLFLHRTASSLLESKALSFPCRFVVISSVWQGVGRPGKYSYTVAKSALGGLVRSWAIDLAPRGISVNSVLPGVTDTPMTRQNLSEAEIAHVVNETPQGKLVTPNEVANAVMWLASTSSSGINGEALVVDGGWMRMKRV